VLQRGQLSLAAFPNDGQCWGTQRAERRLLSSRLSERGRSMLAIIVLGAASGALLGSHFKMLVLGPAILLASFAANGGRLHEPFRCSHDCPWGLGDAGSSPVWLCRRWRGCCIPRCESQTVTSHLDAVAILLICSPRRGFLSNLCLSRMPYNVTLIGIVDGTN
jgi:hypothetical protein